MPRSAKSSLLWMVFPGSWLILACTAFRKVIVKDYLCFIICRDLLTSLFSLNSPSSVFSLATSWSHCPLKQTVSIRARRAELPREPLGNGSLLFFFFFFPFLWLSTQESILLLSYAAFTKSADSTLTRYNFLTLSKYP